MNDARQILESIINEFSVDKFTHFFRTKSQKFTPREESYSHFNDDNFTKGQKVGEINFTDVDSLLVCAFEVTKPLSERAGKKAQYEKARSILKSTINQRFSAGIFIFYDFTGNFRFSLVYPESIGTKRQWNNFRRFTYFVSQEFTNKTFLKQVGIKEFTKLEDIKSAFSITAVTDIFYDEFFKIYDNVVKKTKEFNQIKNDEKARDFVLLFAIRLVFLGFIQKKKWIGDDEKFIQEFFNEYRIKFLGKDDFYIRWLTPLFFEALNSPLGRKVAYGDNDFSIETEGKLQMAPYLNGGLFKPKTGYDDNGWIIPDKEIEDFFSFLFAHSFTIEENSFEDEDLQLNPEFLGIIFERLVNKADGSVYTPRTEVNLMCRLSLVKWLQKNLDNPISSTNLYELFFRESEKAEDQKQGSFSQKEAQEILDKLENLSICDPAVGSGAFLVGMMQVLDDTEQILKVKYNLNGKSAFDRKKEIIKNSLYGVEVKEWAVWICQLRLWLSLFVDAPDDLKNSLLPILPSLDFKVRRGDSLVQRVGSRGVAISADKSVVSGQLLKQLRELIQLKTAHYDTGKPKIDEIEHLEFLFYRNWIQQDITREQNKLVEYNKGISNNQNQQDLFGNRIVEPQAKLNLFQKEREETVEKLEQLRTQLRDLHQTNKPFLWQLEFSEVFSTKGGFDIVIGNPPYVRQEDISDPTGKVKDKKEYKGCLQEMVKMDFPDYFRPKTKINAQSDLYTYFYIRALRLLNPQGIHTFICSNSWLDVGYGVWLQEFLLDRCQIDLIIDNQAKRSFEAADVNTIISIIHAPQKKALNDHLVKFIAFKKPFDSAVFTENLIAIENAKEVATNETFRVYPITNSELKEAGTEYDDEAQTTMKIGKYGGDKWGAKYLRAPEIFFKILDRGAKQIKKLENYFTGERYLNTGGADGFFIITNFKKIDDTNTEVFNNKIISEKHTTPFSGYVENDYLVDLIKDVTKKTKSIDILKPDAKCVVIGKLSDNEEISKYIKWGELQGYNKRSVTKSQNPWYKPTVQMHGGALVLLPRSFNDTFIVHINPEKFLSLRFYRLHPKIDNFEEVVAFLNSTPFWLLYETLGNKNQGQGVIDLSMDDFLSLRLPIVADRKLLDPFDELRKREIKNIFLECGIDPKSDTPIEDQIPRPQSDREALDTIVFNVLGITEEKDQKDVYRAVCRLVWNRINKANSV